MGLFPDEAIFEKQRADREADRHRLVDTLRQAGLLSSVDADSLQPLGTATPSTALVSALHAFLHATRSQVAMVQLEDILGVVDQANMPGTTSEHPNWCRKLPVDIEDVTRRSDVLESLAAFIA